MFETTHTTTGYRAQIRLSNGTIAGAGFGPTSEIAQYFACIDAVRGGYVDAGRGHARYLTAAEEDTIRNM